MSRNRSMLRHSTANGAPRAASFKGRGRQFSLEPLPVVQIGQRIMFGPPGQLGEEMIPLDGESRQTLEGFDVVLTRSARTGRVWRRRGEGAENFTGAGNK